MRLLFGCVRVLLRYRVCICRFYMSCDAVRGTKNRISFKINGEGWILSSNTISPLTIFLFILTVKVAIFNLLRSRLKLKYFERFDGEQSLPLFLNVSLSFSFEFFPIENDHWMVRRYGSLNFFIVLRSFEHISFFVLFSRSNWHKFADSLIFKRMHFENSLNSQVDHILLHKLMGL